MYCGGATSTRTGSIDTSLGSAIRLSIRERGATSTSSSRTTPPGEAPSISAQSRSRSAGSSVPCQADGPAQTCKYLTGSAVCPDCPSTPSPIPPDRNEPTPDRANPAGAFHWDAPSEEGRTVRSVSRPRLQDGRTALRPNIESFQPNDPRGRRTWRQAGSDDRPNPAGPHPGTQPPANASSRPSSSSPAGPRSFDASASIREDSKTTPLQRKTFVPSERPPCRVPVESLLRSSRRTTSMDTSSADDRPILVNGKAPRLTNPPASDRNTSFHLNDQQSVPAERQPADPFVQARLWRAVFTSPPPTLATLCGRPNEPNLHPPHTTHAESRRTGGTRSTVRAAETQPQSTSATASPSPLTF